jgi:hypothetical protein
MPVHIGKKAPDLTVSEWVQGKSSNIDAEGRPLTPTKLLAFIEASISDFRSYSER